MAWRIRKFFVSVAVSSNRRQTSLEENSYWYIQHCLKSGCFLTCLGLFMGIPLELSKCALESTNSSLIVWTIILVLVDTEPIYVPFLSTMKASSEIRLVILHKYLPSGPDKYLPSPSYLKAMKRLLAKINFNQNSVFSNIKSTFPWIVWNCLNIGGRWAE